MLALWIFLAAISGGLIALLIARWLAYGVFARYLHHLVSFSVGVLLAVALLHLLPEAFEGHAEPRADPHALFATMLAAFLIFFVLEKVRLLRHSHHHEGDGHAHAVGHDRSEAGRGGWLILVGSSLHNLVDGVLIAGAFLVDPWLGVLTTASILVHEVPHKLSDFVVLMNAGFVRRNAFWLILLSSLCTVAGGLGGYLTLQAFEGVLPYLLVVAASSFLYIAISDLIPQMHERVALRESASQLLLVGLGALLIYGVTTFMHHGHAHDHDHDHGHGHSHAGHDHDDHDHDHDHDDDHDHDHD